MSGLSTNGTICGPSLNHCQGNMACPITQREKKKHHENALPSAASGFSFLRRAHFAAAVFSVGFACPFCIVCGQFLFWETFS